MLTTMEVLDRDSVLLEMQFRNFLRIMLKLIILRGMEMEPPSQNLSLLSTDQ